MDLTQLNAISPVSTEPPLAYGGLYQIYRQHVNGREGWFDDDLVGGYFRLGAEQVRRHTDYGYTVPENQIWLEGVQAFEDIDCTSLIGSQDLPLACCILIDSDPEHRVETSPMAEANPMQIPVPQDLDLMMTGDARHLRQFCGMLFDYFSEMERFNNDGDRYVQHLNRAAAAMANLCHRLDADLGEQFFDL